MTGEPLFSEARMREFAAALSAQPSPGGQGGHVCLSSTLGDLFLRGWIDDVSGKLIGEAARKDMAAALAARQPVGEPFGWWLVDDNGIGRLSRTPPQDTIEIYRITPGYSATPLYAAPVQAVDLGPEPMFYIQDTRQFVGNCPVWWGPDGSGYVTRLDEAGRYTEQEAVKQNRCRDTDIPWPCAEIEAIARRTVDYQHMRPRAERLAELAQADSQAVGNG